MAELLLVRYGELALKSPPVRREFERQLRHNVLDQFLASGLVGRLRSDHGHLYAEVNDASLAMRALRRVFGVTSVSRVWEVPTDRTAMRERLLALADAPLRPGSSFAVRARRTGTHPFTSQELARDLGSDVLERFADRHLTVDLERPAVELFVEVRGPRTYLSLDRSSGPGGLPLGVAGKLVVVVDGPRGALGAYLMMKRGCRCALIVLPAGRPYVERVLTRFDPKVRVRAVEESGADWASAVAATAEETHADGIVLPIDVDGYATERERWTDRVLFSPTVGFNDEEVLSRWKSVEELAG
ncbi:MAG: THUMP domain-containing protein [Thermoplasmata archaeon]